MTSNKPIVERWRLNARLVPIICLLPLTVISIGLLINAILVPTSAFDIIVGSIVLATMWCAILVLLSKENPCKISLRLVSATPGLEHKLNLAYRKAYETETVAYGVATEYGLICTNGFAPWDAIIRIIFTSKETGNRAATRPCRMCIDVKLDEKTSYYMSIIFSQSRDVSEEIEQQIERIHKFDKSILIINNYVFIG